MNRREALAALLVAAAPAPAVPPKGLKWIAHRGGVVDARYSENSPASLEAAVQEGYWMIESDIRQTRDTKIITHHDPDFKRFYGATGKVVEMDLADIRKLRATPGGTPPMTFEELMTACKGRLRLMLDVKEPDHAPAFYREMEQGLRKAGLLESAYVIGLPSALNYFKGKARVSVNSKQLREAVDKDEDAGKLYFLFEWGKTLNEEQVQLARKHKVTVVPSINMFHYGREAAESLRLGSLDVKRMMQLGVTEFQIDSVYAPAFQ
jgi:glycerophosphoryl diester phosphodiesterase